MTLGSFFDGIGGWLLAAIHAGVEPVWASEIDDFPAAVTAHHFPNVRQMGDITKIDVDNLEPVDIICAGSPCQDLSVAGKREGLSGERSGLFRTAIKLVHGLRARTGKPRYFVWENVPGAFSSNHGLDFRAVLEEVSQTSIPMPACGKWAEAGVVEWAGGSLAWRVLDAQYWGVPQRRKRIFLVADFTGHSAGEILFECQSVPRDSAEGEGERQEAAANVGTSIDSAIGVDIYNNKITGDKVTALTTNNTSTSTAPKVMTSTDSASGTLTPWDVQSNRIQGINGKAAALYGGAGQGTHNGAVFDTRKIDTASGFKYRQGAKAGGIGWQNGKAPTLELSQNCAVYESHPSDCRVKGPIKVSPACTVKWRKGSADTPLVACYDISHRQDVIRPQGTGTLPCLTARAGTGGNNLPIVHCLNDQGGKVMDVSEEKTGTLRAEVHGHAPIVHTMAIGIDQQGGKGQANYAIEKSPTLAAESHGTPHAVCYSMGHDERANTFWDGGQTCSTLTANKAGGNQRMPDKNHFNAVISKKSVRRLTPTECERLQGLPDSWTDVEFNGKPAPDSKRYKAIGNGMAQPVADFVIRRIVEVVSNGV